MLRSVSPLDTGKPQAVASLNRITPCKLMECSRSRPVEIGMDDVSM